MAPEWLSLRIAVPPSARQQALEALFTAGATCVVEETDALVTALPLSESAEALTARIRAAVPAAEVTSRPISNVDWSEAFRRGVGAHQIGTLTVAPPWLAERLDPSSTVIIDPAMAFGTGEHASTRGALRLLEGALRRGDRVADLGAGSGILAIASAKLGASRVAAIENDPQAIGNLQENIDRNGVGDVVTVLEGDAGTLLPLVAPVEMITANIVSSVITQLLPVIERALTIRGRVIVAGIMIEERDAVREEFAREGWRVAREDLEAQWWAAGLERHDRPVTGAHAATPSHGQ